MYTRSNFFFSSSDPKRLPWLRIMLAYITSYRRGGSPTEYHPWPADSPWAISAVRRINALIVGYIIQTRTRRRSPPEAPGRTPSLTRALAEQISRGKKMYTHNTYVY